MRAALVIAFLLASCHRHHPSELACPPAVRDAEALLGTRELPAAIGALACAAAKTHDVVVGLEIWRSEQARLDAYLASDGGPASRRELLAGSFWTRDVQDGRSSEAMAALIESLRTWRAAGARIRLVAFDVASAIGQAARERAMADSRARRQPARAARRRRVVRGRRSTPR